MKKTKKIINDKKPKFEDCGKRLDSLRDEIEENRRKLKDYEEYILQTSRFNELKNKLGC